MSVVRLFAKNAIRYARLLPLCMGQTALLDARNAAKAWTLSGASQCGLRGPDAIASFGGELASSLIDFASTYAQTDIAFGIDFAPEPDHLAQSLALAPPFLGEHLPCLGFHWSIPEYGASAFALVRSLSATEPSHRALPPNIIDALHRSGSTHAYRFKNSAPLGLAGSALLSFAYQLKFDKNSPEIYALAPVSLCERLDLEALRKDLLENPALPHDNVEHELSLAQQVFERRDIDASTPQATLPARRRTSL